MVLLSRAQYQRLCALRARIQDELRRGQRPDGLGSGRSDWGGGSRR